ncbi:hypothetical protein ACCO45_001739 [Purpureocillium lilacinum]|uniref:Uncharacterized protein n=1 Tax=Purpureocillium lilacinum TaxID=33203 RepID=A0ACC4E7V5_PURLI
MAKYCGKTSRIATAPALRQTTSLKHIATQNNANMASLASAARDIPKAASSNRDNLAVVADRSDPATVAPAKAKLEPIDSDLDLHDHPDGNERSPSPATTHEASGAITSALLAKYHLPEILLNHGPLAIRHIMGYLTTSVPGFSGIPPTKARRLVVGALEGRGGEGGGLEGDVEFDKDRSRLNVSGSVGEESVHFSHDDHDDVHMMETEADKMSLDGSASASCSEAPDDDVAMNDDPEDVTDDEDWAAMGAAALRAESYPNMAAAQSSGALRSPNFALPGGLRTFSVSSGMARPPPQPANLDLAALTGTPMPRSARPSRLFFDSVLYNTNLHARRSGGMGLAPSELLSGFLAAVGRLSFSMALSACNGLARRELERCSPLDDAHTRGYAVAT